MEEEKNRIVSASNEKVLWITYINIVLYALSYQLQKPVEPFLIESLIEKEKSSRSLSSLSSSTSSINQTYGNLQSFFSFCQMFGSPLIGILLDRMGIKKTSFVVFLASAISYSLLAQASDLTLLFVSKIPTIFQAAFLVAQATAAATTGDNASLRAAALGRMTTAYTIGATIGPVLGGYLAGNGDFYVSAKVAVVGSMLSALLSLIFLPDDYNNDGIQDKDKSNMSSTTTSVKVTTTCTIPTPTSTSTSPSKSSTPTTIASNINSTDTKGRSILEDIRHSLEIALRPKIWPLLMVKVMGGVCASMHTTAIPLVLTQTLNFTPQQLGLVMSCGMFSVAAFGAFAMAPMNKTLGSFGMMIGGLLSRAVLGIIMAGIVTLYRSSLVERNATITTESIFIQVILVSILHSLSQHALATGLTTQTTGLIDKQDVGSLLGIEHSLFSLSRIFSPTFGSALLKFGILPVEIACGSVDILMVISLSLVLPNSWKTKNT